jgi:hypothetical protein
VAGGAEPDRLSERRIDLLPELGLRVQTCKTDGSSKVGGKFAVAPLPGLNGPGVQDAAYGALQGQLTTEAALSGLQSKLESLTQ